MDAENIKVLLTKGIDIAGDLGVKIIGAIVLWIVGRWIIGKLQKLVEKAMSAKSMDTTVAGYIASFLGILLNIVLVIAILGVFGVETTSFAAVLAAAGVAIGMAWSGILANFAAGIFLLILRPIKVGDFVEAGKVVGTVKELGILVMQIDTMDNVRTIVANKTVFEGTIQNFSTNPHRRVDLVAQLSHDADVPRAIASLKAAVGGIKGISTTTPPDVEILEFNLAGPVLAVRPYCHTDVYWDVYFATNATILKTVGELGFSVPNTHYTVHGGKTAVPR